MMTKDQIMKIFYTVRQDSSSLALFSTGTYINDKKDYQTKLYENVKIFT